MLPILFNLGPFTIYSYGTLVALGFLAVIHLSTRKAQRENIDPQIILDVSLIILISSIIGARLAYVAKNFAYYKENLFEIILVNRGGLFFFGGLLAALVSALTYLYYRDISPYTIGDIIALYLPLGQALGRLGCLLNGCCFGKESALPWAIALPGHETLLHPTQLYESVGSVILFFILYALYQRKQYPGQILLSYLLLYSLLRFLIEFIRGDHPLFAFSLTGSQLVSLGIFLSVGILFVYKLCSGKSR